MSKRRHAGEIVTRHPGSGFLSSAEPALIRVPFGKAYEEDTVKDPTGKWVANPGGEATGCIMGCGDPECREWANVEVASGPNAGEFLFHISECQMDDLVWPVCDKCCANLDDLIWPVCHKCVRLSSSALEGCANPEPFKVTAADFTISSADEATITFYLSKESTVAWRRLVDDIEDGGDLKKCLEIILERSRIATNLGK